MSTATKAEAAAPPALHRVTTEYIEAEDRIRVAGEVAPGHTVVMWLTQRLLNRLLPHLFGWLERHQAPAAEKGPVFAVRAGVMQSFAQKAAVAALQPQAPVPAAGSRQSWLVHAVDITPPKKVLVLVFKGPAGQGAETPAASLSMQAQPLRQWLSILHAQYRRAGWPATMWPEWLAEEAAAPAGGAPEVLH